MLEQAVERETGPVALRYPRGGEPANITDYVYTGADFDYLPTANADTVVVTYGRIFAQALMAQQSGGKPFSLLKLNRVLPIDTEAVRLASNYQRVILLEEGIENGGIAMQFSARLAAGGFAGKTKIRAIQGFVPQGKVEDILHRLGFSAEKITEIINEDVK